MTCAQPRPAQRAALASVASGVENSITTCDAAIRAVDIVAGGVRRSDRGRPARPDPGRSRRDRGARRRPRARQPAVASTSRRLARPIRPAQPITPIRMATSSARQRRIDADATPATRDAAAKSGQRPWARSSARHESRPRRSAGRRRRPVGVVDGTRDHHGRGAVLEQVTRAPPATCRGHWTSARRSAIVQATQWLLAWPAMITAS